MRVLIWAASPLSRQSAFWFWLKTGMSAIGHQVLAVDVMPLAGLFGLRGMQQILLQLAKAYQVQAALVLPQNVVEPWCLEAMKAAGIVLVSLGVDDGMVAAHSGRTRTLGEWQWLSAFRAHCHLDVTVSRHIGGMMVAHGLKEPLYLPFPYGWQAVPADERPLRPVIAYCGSPKQRSASVTSWRVQVALALRDAGLPLELHHDDWAAIDGLADVARPTPGLDTFFVVARTSMVNLVLASEGTDAPYAGIKGLSLEIAAAGGAQVVTPSAELSDILTDGEDVLTAGTKGQVVEAARRLLAEPDLARRLGRNSRQAVQAFGWDRWWEQVASHLAARGVTLDLAGPAVRPEPAETAWLATVMTAVAHAYERQGEGQLADVYYQMVQGWCPDDYAANTGRARLATTAAAALPFWRRAAVDTAPTQSAMVPCPFGMPGVSPRYDTLYLIDALDNWLAAALEVGAMDDVFAALDRYLPFNARVAPILAERLIERGLWGLAQRAVDAGLQVAPDMDELLALRQRLSVTRVPFLPEGMSGP
jgi:hypothetical protein